ncbi:MAG: DUF1444 family protein [Myxococcota bacterium]
MTLWIEHLAARGGPFVEAALKFIAAMPPEDPWPRGKTGVLWLGRTLGRYRASSSGAEEEDRAFVEGAGSLLAVLLLDHFESASHFARSGSHRVRLSRFGVFDPFEAMSSALDAENPRDALALAVREAESEAAGNGPVSSIVSVFASALQEISDDLAVEDTFDLEVTLNDGVDVDLRRLRGLAGDPSALKKAARQMVRMLSGVRDPDRAREDFAEIRDRLLPRLVGRSFQDKLDASGRELALCDLVGDLTLGFVIDYGDRLRFVTERACRTWGMEFPALFKVATNNLAKRSSKARFSRVDTSHGAMVVASTRDGLDASRLILPGLREVLAAELGDQVVCAVPHRDRLVACSATDVPLRESMRQSIAKESRNAPHGISARLYSLTAQGLCACEVDAALAE